MSLRPHTSVLQRPWARKARWSVNLSSTQIHDNPSIEAERPPPSATADTQKNDPLPESTSRLLYLKQRREAFGRLKERFEGLGSTQTRGNTWKPHHSLFKATHPSHLTLSALVAAGAHLGHSKTLMNPAFAPFAYGTRAGVTLIDLDSTLPLLRRAASLVRSVALNGGTVVFVGTRPDLKDAVRLAVERMGDNAYHVGEKWYPGTLTNRVHLFGSKAASTQRVIPDLVVFLNPIPNLHAIRECAISHVPTVGIIDSNVDPRIVMYPIPANDESPRTAELIAGVLSVAGREGNELRRQETERQQESARSLKFNKAHARRRSVDAESDSP